LRNVLYLNKSILGETFNFAKDNDKSLLFDDQVQAKLISEYQKASRILQKPTERWERVDSALGESSGGLPARIRSRRPPDSCDPGGYPKFNFGCIACNPGSFSPDGTRCKTCDPGSLSRVAGLTFCDACPGGTFESSAGSARCSSCPAGTAHNQLGGSAREVCFRCGVGLYFGEGSQQCQPCPAAKTPNERQSDCVFTTAAEELAGATSIGALAAGAYAWRRGEFSSRKPPVHEIEQPAVEARELPTQTIPNKRKSRYFSVWVFSCLFVVLAVAAVITSLVRERSIMA
jgi:hypothetical protein